MALICHTLRRIVFAALLATGLGAAPADADYDQVVAARAEKIVAAIGLPDLAKVGRVRTIVAQQYRDLRAIQEARDVRLATAKSISAEKSAAATAAQAARDEADASVAKLHTAYLARLAAELTPAQIDQVKDGMTYGVLPLTNRVYHEMLPTLTAEQKAQILAWLTEAREHAMDGFTSDEKHAWFGKYKGRINNFLAKAGYNMKEAEKEMLARQKSERAAK